jgi:hypothetical protein
MVGVSICKNQHRDLRIWNHQQTECCISCGSFHIQISDLHLPFKFGDEIRLLCLMPSRNHSSDLIGELIHVRLQDRPVYEAVSYTWADEFGVTKHSGNLFIKSRDGGMNITSNCEAMLRKFRDERHQRILWVDAICVDQSNMLERSEQVQLMTCIYKQASNVLAFVGDHPEKDYDDYREFFDYIAVAKFCPRDSGGPIQDILSDDSTDHTTKLRLWNTLAKFFSHSWFHRIWVVQEVIMAGKLALYFGSFVIDWEDLSSNKPVLSFDPGTAWGGAARGDLTAPQIDIPPVLCLKKKIKSDGARLVDLLSATQTCAATDPRDKIFALLGMAKEENGLQLPRADYSKSVADVFTEAAIYYIRATNSLGVLSLVRSPSQPALSWVPDFANIPSLEPLPRGRKYLSDFQQNVLTTKPTVQPLIFESGALEDAFLTAGGILLDEIQFVQSDEKKILRAASDPVTTFQHLFQIPSADQVPSVLLHCPSDHPVNLFTSPPPGVDPNDLTAIDLLAPYHEHARSMASNTNHSPLCESVITEFYNSVLEYGGGRGISCGIDTLGIVPADTQPGDSIWMLATASNPLVLRRVGKDKFTVVGPCAIISPSNPSSCTQRENHRRGGCKCQPCLNRARYVKMTSIYGVSIV